MAIPFKNDVDFEKNELQNPVLHPLSAAPGTPATGQQYFDTTLGYGREWDGSAWQRIGGEAFGLSNSNPDTITPDQGSNSGSSNAAARVDHVHNLPAAPPGASAVGDTATEGSAASVARSDHRHEREDFGAVVPEQSFGSSSANGSSGDVARADHQHGTPAHGNAQHTTIPLSTFADPTANVGMGGQRIVNMADPVNDQDGATKGYVDGLSQGLDTKGSVRAATTGNLTTLIGTQTIDGVSLVADDRVLVKDQNDASDNGIYLVKAGAWVRADDMDADGEVAAAYTFVEEGTANGDSGWLCTSDEPFDLGTDDMDWVQFSGAGQITAGDGLTKTGNRLDVGQGVGIIVNPNDIRVNYYAAAPEPDGAASSGASNLVARGDHVHPIASGTAFGAAATITGDGTTTAFVVTHNLGTLDVVTFVRENSGQRRQVFVQIEGTSTNTVTIRFAIPPANGEAFRVKVVG